MIKLKPFPAAVCAAVAAALAQFPAPASAAVGDAPIPGLAEPPTYVVGRTSVPVAVDGRLDDAAWQLAPRTNSWRWLDTGEPGRLGTYGQMCWDDDFLYFAFHAVDPDIWSTMQIRDEPVFVEEDFEIFLDPEGDEFHYYEWQINPLGTLYDVIWARPANTPGPPSRGIHAFDLTPMLSGHQVHGTVWQRDDADTGWSAEVALSWEGLAQIPGRFRAPPQAGDTWRIGFSRVESPPPPHWQADWTWPIHGEYNMHIGQRDGYVQFSDQPLGPEPPAPAAVPRLFAVEVRVEPEHPSGGVPPGHAVSLVPRIGNRGADAASVEVRLSCPDSMVTVLDSVATVGPVVAGEARWAADGFAVRLSRAAHPGRNLLFQLAMVDGQGRWSGDYFFAFAAGRAWRTVFQVHEGVQALLADGPTLWGISRANIWRWSRDGEVLGFYQADDGIPRHARLLARDGRGRIWTAGERGISHFDGNAWQELAGEEGLPERGFERLCAGPQGAMWVAAREGIYRYDQSAEVVWSAADGFQPGRVRELVVDGSGTAWAVGDSLVYRAGPGGRQVLGKQHGLPSSRLTALAQDRDGNVWLAGIPTGRSYRDGGVGRYDGASWRVWRRADGLLTNEVTALYADRDGRIWAGHPGGGVSVFDGQAWDSWPAAAEAGCFECAPPCGDWVGGAGGFLQDDAGRVWLVGTRGLAMFDAGQWRTWTWRNGLFGGRARAVAQGPGGRVYVGDARSVAAYEP